MSLNSLLQSVLIECTRTWGGRPVAPVSVHVSSRLRVSLARCYPESSQIRVHPRLPQESTDFVREVLVHELAHLAVCEKYGATVKPHGPEWRDHVYALGLVPRVHFFLSNMAAPTPGLSLVGPAYRHRCPVCQFTRYSRRPQRRWRCAVCVAAGLAGDLVIESMSQSTEEQY